MSIKEKQKVKDEFTADSISPPRLRAQMKAHNFMASSGYLVFNYDCLPRINQVIDSPDISDEEINEEEEKQNELAGGEMLGETTQQQPDLTVN